MLTEFPYPATAPGGDILKSMLPGLLLLLTALPGDLDPRSVSVIRASCLECHSGPEPKGDLAFDLKQERAGLDAARWREVWERVHKGEMPPRKRQALSETERTSLLDASALLAAGAEEQAVLRRLSRREYENTVRDLFGVAFDARAHFAPDEIGSGFDNQGSALSLSDADFERYLQAGERVAALVIDVRDPDKPSRVRLQAGDLDGGSARGDVRSLTSNGQIRAKFQVQSEGRYRVVARCFGTQAGPDPARYALLVEGKEFARGETRATMKQREEVSGEVRLAQGTRAIEFAFLNDYYKPDDPDPKQRDRNLHLEWLELEGPLDPPRYSPYQQQMLADLHAGNLRAKLETLAEQAWRGPVTKQDVDALLALTNAAHSPLERIRTALAALLASPRFLFLVETDSGDAKPGTLRRLDAYELAARLSYFAWGSAPDDALRRRAADGSLLTDAGLADELTRMLRDPRAAELSRSFAVQWLQLESLEKHDIDPALRESMLAGTVMFFECLLRENRPIAELLNADYTFADERLAKLYRIALPRGPGFQRVTIPGRQRTGILGHASVLAATSNPTRTSPVKRGKWILEVLLDAPPPPPPPGVGVLPEAEVSQSALSMREQLAKHRANAECAVCHDRLDPLGLGLESFDRLGAWREGDASGSIESAGVLPDGRRFRDAAQMIELLAADGSVARSLARHMMTYALGRSLSIAERVALERRLEGRNLGSLTIPDLAREIILSEPFRTKRVSMP